MPHYAEGVHSACTLTEDVPSYLVRCNDDVCGFHPAPYTTQERTDLNSSSWMVGLVSWRWVWLVLCSSFLVCIRSRSSVFSAKFAMSSAILNQLNSTGFLYERLAMQVFSVCVY